MSETNTTATTCHIYGNASFKEIFLQMSFPYLNLQNEKENSMKHGENYHYHRRGKRKPWTKLVYVCMNSKWMRCCVCVCARLYACFCVWCECKLDCYPIWIWINRLYFRLRTANSVEHENSMKENVNGIELKRMGFYLSIVLAVTMSSFELNDFISSGNGDC